MSESDHAWATAVTFITIAGIAGFAVLARGLGVAFAVPVGILSVIGAAVVLRGPVGKALARRLEGGASQPPPEEVLLELDELRQRMLELEERVDFSERLLAQGRSTPDAAPRR